MNKITIDKERCKGCGFCVSVCPVNLLEIGKELNLQGHYHAKVVSYDGCSGCCNCALICPDVAIEIYRD
ncbi:TPA: hypothetical protein DCX15_06610 [bacterium]|nr:hypothetical protein [bacterium]